MEFEFKNDDLRRLYVEIGFTAGLPEGVVRAFRKRMQLIRAALDERDLYEVKGNRFEKLKGNRQHQHSLRLNNQMRLIVEIKPHTPKNIIVIVEVEDYH